ncbi:MAG: conserved phage C-terminal domain-containing protein [Anaerovoracaceae bacterium]
MKNPAFLFYPSDFIIGTMDMTDEEVGRYMRLLCRQFEQGSIAPKYMENVSVEVLKKFCKDRKGNYFNRRLKSEIDKRKKYSESRSSNRSKGAQSKKDMKNISETYEEHMENENINENIYYIISFLNHTCKTKYKTNSKKTISLIKAREKEGFTVEDFKTVIIKKAAEWKGTAYEKYLRPETLFGTKFEGYLNQPVRGKGKLNDFYIMTNEWAEGEEND